MVTKTKAEARQEGILESCLCKFHLIQPDQRASMETCEDCTIIQDPCGCDEYMTCEECHPEEFYRYVFTCSKRECLDKMNRPLFFSTDDIREAEKHSRENNCPMWVHKEDKTGDIK